MAHTRLKQLMSGYSVGETQSVLSLLVTLPTQHLDGQNSKPTKHTTDLVAYQPDLRQPTQSVLDTTLTATRVRHFLKTGQTNCHGTTPT